MDLVLTVVGCPPHANMLNHTKLFRQGGGFVGRSDANDWVLPDTDRIVSSRHIEIQFVSGKFLIIDHSTNGTFVNENQAPLGIGNSHELVSGDVINCGDYQLRAAIKSPKAEAPAAAGLGSVDFLDGGDRTTFNHATAARQKAISDAKEFDSWLDPVSNGEKTPDFADGWGVAPQEFKAPPTVNSDPWAQASPVSPMVGGEEERDPLAALSRQTPGPVSSGADWGDDWWKEGSASDHVPADQHNMQIHYESSGVKQEPVSGFSPPEPAAAGFNPFAASTVDDSQKSSVDHVFDHAGSNGSQASVQIPPPAEDPLRSVGFNHRPSSENSFTNATSATEAPYGNRAESGSRETAASVQSGGLYLSQEDVKNLVSLLGAAEPDKLRAAAASMPDIVSETVARLIDLLRARTAIKNELRVQHTLIQTVDNNPLKFSATAEDAFKVMFNGSMSAFMSPLRAVQDSFDDLSDHQVAVLKGMNAAYEAMLRHFDPVNLKRLLNTKDSLLGSRDAKNWVAFEQHYDELKRDYESTYNKLFGEEFARGYEKKLSDLKSNRLIDRGC